MFSKFKLDIFTRKTNSIESAPFSEFIRTGKSREKKKVFVAVLKDSVIEQKKIIAEAKKNSKKHGKELA